MSISLPTYRRREMPLLGRRARVLVIVMTGLRKEFRRPAVIFSIASGSLVITVISIFLLLFAPIFLQGQPLDVRFFYIPASNGAILFFVTLMAAVVGSGLIAEDVHSMALTLYLSRPISPLDYLAAKAAILATLVSTLMILPLALTPLIAGFLGLVPWGVALPAIGIGVGVGLLLTAFYSAVGLFLSSLTRRKAYAGAGIFALTFGLNIPVQALGSPLSPGYIGIPALFYLSPWENFLAVARAAYGAGPGQIDWSPALAILLTVTVLAAVLTYLRMRSMEVVTG